MHVIMEDGKSKICRVAYQPGDPRRVDIAGQVRRLPGGRIPSCSGEVSLCSIKAFNLWKAVCFTQSPPISMLIIPQNTFTKTSRRMFDHICGHCGPGKLTHKINYHTCHVLVGKRIEHHLLGLLGFLPGVQTFDLGAQTPHLCVQSQSQRAGKCALTHMKVNSSHHQPWNHTSSLLQS